MEKCNLVAIIYKQKPYMTCLEVIDFDHKQS